MQLKMLRLIPALLLAACAPEVSSPLEKADRLTIPDVKAYTDDQQERAADEMTNSCNIVPVICGFVIDYGVMRDQARAALGQTVDTTR